MVAVKCVCTDPRDFDRAKASLEGLELNLNAALAGISRDELIDVKTGSTIVPGKDGASTVVYFAQITYDKERRV